MPSGPLLGYPTDVSDTSPVDLTRVTPGRFSTPVRQLTLDQPLNKLDLWENDISHPCIVVTHAFLQSQHFLSLLGVSLMFLFPLKQLGSSV